MPKTLHAFSLSYYSDIASGTSRISRQFFSDFPFSSHIKIVAAPAFCGGQESYGFSYSIILLYCKQITGKPSNCNRRNCKHSASHNIFSRHLPLHNNMEIKSIKSKYHESVLKQAINITTSRSIFMVCQA